jgi:dihydropyrimidinase
MNLVIQNGTIVTATETYQADIGIKDGVIALIGQPALFPPQPFDLAQGRLWGGGRGSEVIDATGKYVLPGGVDVHVHLQMTIGDGSAELAEAITSSDDFTTGTIAAACGGTTTIIDFITPQPGQSLHQAVAERRSQADGHTAIDYGLHLTATNARPKTLAEIEELAAAGYTSLKLYTTYPALMVNDAEILDLMAAAAACGVLPIVHAENHWAIEYLKQKLLAQGKTAPRYHPRSRPPLAEAEAANRVVTLAQLTQCPVYLAHLTCRESLEVVRRHRAQGQRVYGEVCTQHLILSKDEYERPGFEGAKFVLSPPLRDKSNWEPLWHALTTGTLQVISTDHCPWMFATHKQRGRDDFTKIPNGAPGIETRVPLIYHFGVNEGRFSINKFVELVSTAPARLFGLWPRKGTIAVGSDADLVIFDPHQECTLTQENLHMNVDYSPYEHVTVRGYPVMTIAGGKVIVKDNEFVGQVGAGQFLERKPFGF